jgi:hypothetical protein
MIIIASINFIIFITTDIKVIIIISIIIIIVNIDGIVLAVAFVINHEIVVNIIVAVVDAVAAGHADDAIFVVNVMFSGNMSINTSRR